MILFLRKYARTLGLLFLLGTAANLIALGFPVLLKHLVDGAAMTHRISGAPALLALVAVLALGSAITAGLRDIVSVRLSARFDSEVSATIFSRILRVSMTTLRSRSTGDWRVVLQQVHEAKLALGQLGALAVFDVFLVAGYFVLLYRYDPPAGWLYLALSFGTGFAMWKSGQALLTSVDRGYEERGVSETYLAEALRSPLLVRAFDLSGWMQERWAKPYARSVILFRRADYLGAAAGAFFELVHQTAPLLVLAWKLPEVSRGTLTFGTALAMSTVFGLGFDPFLKIAAMLSQMQKAVLSFRKIRDVVADDEEEPLGDVLAGPLSISPMSLRFDRVTFHYPGNAEPVLVDFSLEATPGQRVAVVGHSGSGKTTLMHLLLRLYPISGGRLLIDDKPIEAHSTKALRRHIGIVSQDTELFAGSVLDNIALGAALPDRSRAEECARLGNALEFIERLPQGLDTFVGESGNLLSAGQRQRLSLARAIYWNPRLLLLDEPTSALDAITEREIADALPRIGAGRTILVSAHRLGTILDFDRIYVLDRGRVVEWGRHEELVRQRGYYSRLWQARAERGPEQPGVLH